MPHQPSSIRALIQYPERHAAYERLRDLPKLVPLWPQELADSSQAGRMRLLAKLRRALRQERQRGVAGHWTYDLARHKALLRAYRAEAHAALKVLPQPIAKSATPNTYAPPVPQHRIDGPSG